MTVTEAFLLRLRQFAELKEQRDEAKSAAKTLDARYRAAEAGLVEEFAEGITSTRVDGLGTFYLTSRTYTSVGDLVALLKWAEQEGLVQGLDWSPDNSKVTCTFDVQMVEEDDGTQKPALINGVLKVGTHSKPLNDHVAELRAEGEADPPGLKVSTFSYVGLKRAR